MPGAPGPAGRKLSAGLDARAAPSPTHPPREGGRSRLPPSRPPRPCTWGSHHPGLPECGRQGQPLPPRHAGILPSMCAAASSQPKDPADGPCSSSLNKEDPSSGEKAAQRDRGGVWSVCPPASIHSMPSIRHALPTPTTAEPMLSSPAQRCSPLASIPDASNQKQPPALSAAPYLYPLH